MVNLPERIEPATVAKTTVLPTVATVAKSRKAKKTKAATVTPVLLWHTERTINRQGSKVKPSEAYKDYAALAEERGEQAMSFTAFGIAMRDELKVEKEVTTSNRQWYLDIALLSRPKLAVAN
jgi:hypothetical protein